MGMSFDMLSCCWCLGVNASFDGTVVLHVFTKMLHENLSVRVSLNCYVTVVNQYERMLMPKLRGRKSSGTGVARGDLERERTTSH